jgi:MFS family permease
LTRDTRRLIAFISIAMVVDTAAYATITPLLPHLAEEFHLSKAAAGALSASYPVGTLVASLPAGALAARLGPKRTVLYALAVLAGSSLVFGVASSAGVLVVARTLQGIGAAAVWAGGLAWVIAVAPADRRGEAIGTAIGAAIAGTLGGPVLGAVADAIGREVVFLAFVALPAALIVALARVPAPDHVAMPTSRALFRDRRVRIGIVLMTLPSACFGAVNVLVPLRLDDLGAGATAIAAVFLVAVAIESVMSPVAGRLADRRGPITPARYGLVAGAIGLVLLPLPQTVVLVGVVVAATCGLLGLMWAPAMSMLGDAAERHELNPAFAFSLGNLAWGVGTAIGGSGGGALAGVTADAVPYVAIAGVMALVAATLRAPSDPLPPGRPAPHGRGGSMSRSPAQAR